MDRPAIWPCVRHTVVGSVSESRPGKEWRGRGAGALSWPPPRVPGASCVPTSAGPAVLGALPPRPHPRLWPCVSFTPAFLVVSVPGSLLPAPGGASAAGRPCTVLFGIPATEAPVGRTGQCQAGPSLPGMAPCLCGRSSGLGSVCRQARGRLAPSREEHLSSGASVPQKVVVHIYMGV